MKRKDCDDHSHHSCWFPAPYPRAAQGERRARAGELSDADFTSLLQAEVDGVVKRQAEIGLDIVNDGEYGHAMLDTVDYGAWWTYSFSRFGGLSFEDVQRFDVRPPAGRDGRLSFSSFAERRDWQRFADAYADPDRAFTSRTVTRSRSRRSRAS